MRSVPGPLDDPGVVPQDVKAAVTLPGRVQEQLERVLIADIARGRHHLGTRGPQPAGLPGPAQPRSWP